MTTSTDAPALRETNLGKTFPPEVYSPAEVQALVRACSTRAKTGIRNRALIVLLYRSGLRLSEALALRLKDMDRTNGMLRVLHGKNDKARTVGMDDAAFAYLDTWLAVRESLGIGARSPIFCTLAGEPIETAYIRALLPRLGRKAGIERRCHAHGLRHTHAFELAMEGIDMLTISQQLGHTSIATTDKYVRHLNPARVVETMRARHWEAA